MTEHQAPHQRWEMPVYVAVLFICVVVERPVHDSAGESVKKGCFSWQQCALE